MGFGKDGEWSRAAALEGGPLVGGKMNLRDPSYSLGTLVLLLGGWQGYDDGGYAKLRAWIGLGV